jgi:hypothetical protein
MKTKTLFFLLMAFSQIMVKAALPPTSSGTASEIAVQLSSEDLVLLTPTKYKELTGEKLGLKGKIALYLLKKEVKKSNLSEPILLEEALAEKQGGINIIGFLAGFFLAFIGVLAVYLLAPDDKAMLRSSLIGLGALAALYLLILIAL